MPGYFDDLSDCSEADSESDDDGDELKPSASTKMSANQASFRREEPPRCIIHVDVDAFYCQCEKIDRNIPDDRPFAIGQKHIIVTANYAARRLGVKKLELRETAYTKCPNLLILEGSDLTRYRIHARRIYHAFRNACKQISTALPVAKGSMDEMTADLTLACADINNASASKKWDNSSIYVYGDNGTEQTVLTEDQTGDSVVVVEDHANHHNGGAAHKDPTTAARLQYAASLALRIRTCILQETSFCVTIGVSTNPLLAKLASGLKKPGTVNLLYPWRSKQLLEHLPLRTLHGAGRRTLQVLDPCLRKRFPNRKEPIVWTCRDLRAVPDCEIAACLDQLPSRESSKDQVQTLLLKCAGIDNTPIEDDLGGLPKTVSVEDSFRRGTVTTRDAVIEAAKDVCSRLPALLHERSLASNNTLLAYPTTLRLTVRLVIDPNDPCKTSRQPGRSRRRPFETFSKQIPFPGKTFVKIDESQKPELLYQNISGMLRALVLDKPCFDVTRLNLAATNFGDLDTGSGVHHGSPSKQRILSQTASFFTQTQQHSQVLSQPQSQPTLKDRKRPQQAAAASMDEQVAKEPGKKQFPPSVAKYKSVAASASSASLATKPSWSNKANLQFSDLDPTVLNELPPDVRADILKSFPPTPFSGKKRTRIDDFFQPVNSKK